MNSRPRASMVRISGSCLARKSASIGLAPASGKSTLTPSFRSGAVIIKMMSSTSMTSIYGTTLISPIKRRRRCREAISLSLRPRRAVTLQDRREFLDESVESQFQPADLICEPVVGDHSGDCREQADGGRDQRFRNAGSYGRKGCLLHVTQIVKRAHDAPDGAEQSHVGTRGTDGGQHGEMLFQPIQLAQLSDAHGAPRPLEQLLGGHALLAQAAEFPETGLEYAL